MLITIRGDLAIPSASACSRTLVSSISSVIRCQILPQSIIPLMRNHRAKSVVLLILQ